MAKIGKTKFQKELIEAVNEKDVENTWRKEIKNSFPKASIISPHNTDGILKAKYPYIGKDNVEEFTNIHTLLEFKDKKGFKEKRIRCAVLMQALFYLHNIIAAKEEKPTTLFIGDSNECFFLNTSVLEDYLNKTECIDNNITTTDNSKKKHIIDWTKPPSTASANNIPLLNEMIKDKTLDDTFIVNVQTDTFRVKDIFPILEELTRNKGKTIRITEYNLVSAFQYFKESVVKQKQTPLFNDTDDKGKLSRLIDVFYNLITDKKTTALNDEGDILTRGGVVEVDKKQYNAFFNLFERYAYTQSEKEKLLSIKDQVLEEISRRMTGAYFTPDLWINKAHEMISEQFGNNWKEKYVVWDCASGTNNLTRQYTFKELYNSTDQIGDVNNVKDMNYPGKTFQYDFLNDDDRKLPSELQKALRENKPILFLINPPYGTSGSMIGGKKPHKTGISTNIIINGELKKSPINLHMKENGMGACSDQLYAQFIYKIIQLKKQYKLVNINICIFSPPIFMSSESYAKFRDLFYSNFTFKQGILFQASEFQDVKSGWGISFTLWEGTNAVNNL